MNYIKDKEFGGERPLFESHNLRLERVTINEGESAIKECSDIECVDCRFIGKYPLWHVERSLVTGCHFEAGARSAIWYSNHMTMRDTVIDAPKFFREMNDLTLERVTINDADETFWNVRGLRLRDVTLHGGTYPFMGCADVDIDGLTSDSKYVFQYAKNVVIRNARITTKDAFWEVENVTVIDSEIDGEFLGWHSKNLRLVNCHLSGQQLLCYADGLVLENCTFGDDSDLMFEYSTVNADIRGHIAGVKNPASGRIIADSIGQIILDGNIKPPANCQILVSGQNK